MTLGLAERQGRLGNVVVARQLFKLLERHGRSAVEVVKVA